MERAGGTTFLLSVGGEDQVPYSASFYIPRVGGVPCYCFPQASTGSIVEGWGAGELAGGLVTAGK